MDKLEMSQLQSSTTRYQRDIFEHVWHKTWDWHRLAQVWKLMYSRKFLCIFAGNLYIAVWARHWIVFFIVNHLLHFEYITSQKVNEMHFHGASEAEHSCRSSEVRTSQSEQHRTFTVNSIVYECMFLVPEQFSTVCHVHNPTPYTYFCCIELHVCYCIHGYLHIVFLHEYDRINSTSFPNEKDWDCTAASKKPILLSRWKINGIQHL